MGRPPIATELKKKRTIKKDNIKFEDEPKPDIFKFSPDPHRILDEHGVRIWEEVCPQLVSLGIFTNIDKDTLAVYCNELGLYYQACEKLKSDGFIEYTGENNYPIPSPWVGIRNRSIANAIKLSHEFGLSPASRTRISVGASKPVGKRAAIIDKLKKKA